MKKIKLGIADDNKEVCDILKDYFSEKESIDIVFVCHDGLKTIECIEKTQPEILILDMVMPHLDGLGVLEMIDSLDMDVYQDCRIISSRSGADNAESYRIGSRVLHSKAV